MEELDIKELLQMFWDKKIQIILIIAMLVTIGIIYTIGFVTPKYQSSTTLLLATNSAVKDNPEAESITTTDVTINSKLVSTYSELVKSNKIIRTVISNLGINASENSIRNSVSVKAKADTEVIEITVRNEDPKISAQIANEIAKVFIENIKEFYGIENVHVVDEAEVPTEPSNINYVKNVVIFGFIGFVIAAVYVLIANMLDTTIKSKEEIEKISGLTVLATLPLYEKIQDKRGGKRK